MSGLEEFVDQVPAERSWSEIVDMIGPEKRRFALYHFLETGEKVVGREKLAESIREKQEKFGSKSRRINSLNADLHHSDIPRLEDLEVVEYDLENSEVTYIEDEDLEMFLETVHEYEMKHFGYTI